MLDTQQLEVISALSTGATMTAAAHQAGIHRNTIANWRRNSLPFQRALADAQYDRALLYREKMEELVDLAVQSIHEILAGPKTSAATRLKAALAVIQLTTTPPPPKKQIELIVETVAAQPIPPMHKTAQPAATPPPPPPMHNSAQQPIRRDHPKVGRNDPCPCGSTQKYKRCCLDKPAPLASAA